MTSFHNIEMKGIDGKDVKLSTYKGKVCLVVNVASRCGLTPQYTGLQALQDAHAAEGFTVLGFPCNQFGAQEPGTDAQVCEFAQSKFDVTFPMFSKIEVNGDGACELYRVLKAAQPNEDGTTDIQWNFTKFLVGRDGKVLKRFSPRATPEDIGTGLKAYL
jgi:glutathione peroxidase